MRYQLILVVALILKTKSSAQELFVFSDLALFAQKDLSKIDCDSLLASKEYEVLSPALERGDFLTLLVVVKHLAGQAFVLETGQYPPRALSLRSFRLFPGTDTPLELTRVSNSLRGRIGENQRCAIFILDAEVPRNISEGRLKLEPALWVPGSVSQNGWLRYPMEIRVMQKEAAPFEIQPTCTASKLTLDHLLIRNLSREGLDCLSLSEHRTDTQYILGQRRLRGKNK